MGEAQWREVLAQIKQSPASCPAELVSGLQSLLGEDWAQKLDLLSYEGTVNAERIMPSVLLYRIPAGFRGLILVTLIAASMSTFDMTMNKASAMFTNDIYRRFLRPKAKNRELLTATYAFCGGVVAVAFVALAGNLGAGWLRVDMATLATEKPIAESLAPGGRVIRTEWDTFARTDLVDPADGGPYQLYMDGAAGSVMPPAENNDFLMRDIGLFPFATAQPERVFAVGPGGGLDVWFGLQSGAQEIVAVEVNPASVSLVQDLGNYNGDLYEQPAVRVIIDEGRSVLRRQELTYDLISLSQVVTLAAERSGYALTENTIYTVEAFEDYLAHLRPNGQIAIKLYDEPTLTRALSTALAAFRQRGLSDA